MSDLQPSAENQVVVRPLNRNDAAQGYALSCEAGWNQNEADWRFLLETCRGYGVELPGRGLVGTTMGWEFPGNYSWINMVLVRAECRGQGLARKMMEACLVDVRAGGRMVLLDATDMGAKVYQKLGFSGEERIVRMRLEDRSSEFIPEDESIVPLVIEDVTQAAKLDHEVVGIDRRELLVDFQQRLPSAGWVQRDAGGDLRSFVFGRDGRLAQQLGPIIAPTRMEARSLLMRALSHTSGPVIIDVPEAHDEWVAELKHLGFVPKRSFIRMGLDRATFDTDWSRYFAICGPDFA
jgi:GNAT superfamily N-acetyltransferase